MYSEKEQVQRSHSKKKDPRGNYEPRNVVCSCVTCIIAKNLLQSDIFKEHSLKIARKSLMAEVMAKAIEIFEQRFEDLVKHSTQLTRKRIGMFPFVLILKKIVLNPVNSLIL